ncbi:glycoside hydrolase [Mycena maculata]|uniref:Glycoside hydrolase n=1 Tax=Mycena maculata TaxID=230809 RepID=A0AAD7NIL8_9AGAR|nr:glycoside hydrolase [Mycena maculata]
MFNLLLCLFVPAVFVHGDLLAPDVLTLTISANATHTVRIPVLFWVQSTTDATQIPSTLYGYMWEVKETATCLNTTEKRPVVAMAGCTNRAFQAVIPGTQNALTAWQPFNGARFAVTSKTSGVSPSLPNSLEVQIPKVVTGPIGFENTGYWGTKRLDVPELILCKGGRVYWVHHRLLENESQTVVTGIGQNWKKFTFEFQPSVSADTDDNVFNVVVDGKAAASQTLYFGMFSLFPPTPRSWLGFREGIILKVEALIHAGDGTTPLARTPGISELGGRSRCSVWDGVSIQNYSDLTTWSVVPEADLQPYIDDVLNEIEFIVGDAESTAGGKLRAISTEIVCRLPVERVCLRHMRDVSRHGIIATSLPSTALSPAYQRSGFTNNSFMFDDYPRNGTKWSIGEYDVTFTNDNDLLGTIPDGRLPYPTLQGAAAEAAFMTVMERNSDVVFASAYAPSFQHIKNYQWTPDILAYDASRLVKSTSYYVQQMFSLNRGTHVLGTTPAPSHETVSNTGVDDLVAYIFLDFSVTGFEIATEIASPALSPISGLFNISNTLDEPALIIPVATSFALLYKPRVCLKFRVDIVVHIYASSHGKSSAAGHNNILILNLGIGLLCVTYTEAFVLRACCVLSPEFSSNCITSSNAGAPRFSLALVQRRAEMLLVKLEKKNKVAGLG